MRYKLSNFNFELPKNRIAQFPSEQRELSKLMVVHRDTGKIEHKVFKDILEYFDSGDVMIMNDTRVFPARLYGKKEKTGAMIEVFLLRELNKEMKLWDVLVDPARKIRVGNKLYFNDAKGNEVLVAEVVDNTTSRGRTIRFFFDGTTDDFMGILDQLGNTPLPKYITRTADENDKDRYQTVYAKNIGSAAAPTAGLHFTKELLKEIENKGITICYVTLHVGLGTFRPVAVSDVTKHKMHSEFYSMTKEVADTLNKAKLEGRNIIAVGTTTTRTLETIMNKYNTFKGCSGWTDIFIYPGYEFKGIDGLITNFHLPKSTLVMLVSAFASKEIILNAYKHAVDNKYRFFSFGDAMFIHK